MVEKHKRKYLHYLDNKPERITQKQIRIRYHKL